MIIFVFKIIDYRFTSSKYSTMSFDQRSFSFRIEFSK